MCIHTYVKTYRIYSQRGLGKQRELTNKEVTCIELKVYIYIYIHVYIYGHTHVYMYIYADIFYPISTSLGRYRPAKSPVSHLKSCPSCIFSPQPETVKCGMNTQSGPNGIKDHTRLAHVEPTPTLEV